MGRRRRRPFAELWARRRHVVGRDGGSASFAAERRGSGRMHVLIIHQAFASAAEAGGTRHHEFARHLVGRGHRVTVVAGRVNYLTGADADDETANVEPGITILRPYTYGALHKSFVHRAASY